VRAKTKIGKTTQKKAVPRLFGSGMIGRQTQSCVVKTSVRPYSVAAFIRFSRTV
jgi:hypothetical protein